MFQECCGRKPVFRFSRRGYRLSKAVLEEYRRVKELYRNCDSELQRYGSRGTGEDKMCTEIILRCLEFYDASERLANVLLVEVLRPGTDIRREKSVFVLFEKLTKIFYLFDLRRFSAVAPFHDFAVLKNRGKLRISESKMQRMALFAAIAMPMAHLFVSSFRSNTFELHIPQIVVRRNLIHIDQNRKKALKLICTALCDTKFRYAAVFFCAAHNRFFPTRAFKGHIDTLGPQKRQYYETMLLLN